MMRCPVCSDAAPVPLSTISALPVIACHFPDSRSDAVEAALGTLELVLCPECGHIYNTAFEPERLSYTPGYENALGFSGRYRGHLDATTEHLIDRYDLHDKSIVEIGCGSGDFLRLLCCRGGNYGIGYDPTQQGRVIEAGEGRVTIRPETFSATNQEPVDFVCSQHVLEHLAELKTTLRQARTILKQGGAGYFEVPNGLAVVRNLNIWDLTYEHVSYFSPMSLQRALSEAGFSIPRLETSFGGQYLGAEVVAGGSSGTALSASADTAGIPSYFPDAFGAVLDDWKHRIARAIAGGRQIVLWGAGAKAVNFLNMLGIKAGDGIDYVVDINPRKAGRFLPGTAQKIIPPEQLRDCRPDVVVVMNPEYTAEIQSKIESIGLQCEVMTVSSAA